jgi:hypothetical protein
MSDTYENLHAQKVAIETKERNKVLNEGFTVGFNEGYDKAIEEIDNHIASRALTAAQDFKDGKDMSGLAEPSSVSPPAQDVKRPWICFHCEFETTDPAVAAAHFGDRDDAEEFKPICKWWARLSEDERVETLQNTVQQLNESQSDYTSLSEELKRVKLERDEARDKGMTLCCWVGSALMLTHEAKKAIEKLPANFSMPNSLRVVLNRIQEMATDKFGQEAKEKADSSLVAAREALKKAAEESWTTKQWCMESRDSTELAPTKEAWIEAKIAQWSNSGDTNEG